MNSSNVPQFSTDPSRAKALDLSGNADNLGYPEAEKWDVVNQMSIARVAPLGKWVMIYGGDLNHGILSLVGATPDPEGAMHVRFASHPWGPWSRPQQLFKAGNPEANPNISGSQYAAGGILHHPGCTNAPPKACLTSENVPDHGHGFLYGANIVDVWTEDRGTSGVDIY